MDEKLKEVNTKRVQILKPFVSKRGNYYYPQIKEPGTITLYELEKADYVYLEDNEFPVNVEKKYDLTSKTNEFIKEHNPTLTSNKPQETKIVENNLNKQTTTSRKPTNKTISSTTEVE